MAKYPDKLFVLEAYDEDLEYDPEDDGPPGDRWVGAETAEFFSRPGSRPRIAVYQLVEMVDVETTVVARPVDRVAPSETKGRKH